MVWKTIRDTSGQTSFLEDSIDHMYFVLYWSVRDSRYINRQPYRTRLSTDVFQIDLQLTDDENGHRPFLSNDEFLQKYRMSRQSFAKLVSLIDHHPVFDACNRGPKQLPPAFQLMVFLKYIGTEGSGNSNPDLRNIFRTGRGTNDLYKMRVVRAIQSLRTTYYTWPDEAEKKAISARILKAFHLPNCIGFADGTLNPLATKPRRQDAADYYGRKHGYSLSTLIICDDRRLIRYYLAGWPGSCHDNRIFRNSQLAVTPLNYFSEKEYLLGDSAFEAAWYMVPAFKKTHGCCLPQEYENFNSCLSAARVTSEHTIGIWKARFPWLRNIRTTITDDRRSMKAILHFIECTVILHNFLIQENERDIPQDWLCEDDTVHLDENECCPCSRISQEYTSNAVDDLRQ